MDDTDHTTFILSPLSQRVTRGGISVDIEIYRAEGDTEWFLEVLDHTGGSTVFDDPFPSDQAALDAALLIIEREGIETFLEDQTGTIH